MPDPIGSIIVCGDYKGDLPAIVESLNSLHFADNAGFMVRNKADRLRKY